MIERETLPLMKTGDAFRRMVVTDGNSRLWTDENGVSHVGVIPFLLDAAILDSIVSQPARRRERPSLSHHFRVMAASFSAA